MLTQVFFVIFFVMFWWKRIWCPHTKLLEVEMLWHVDIIALLFCVLTCLAHCAILTSLFSSCLIKADKLVAGFHWTRIPTIKSLLQYVSQQTQLIHVLTLIFCVSNLGSFSYSHAFLIYLCFQWIVIWKYISFLKAARHPMHRGLNMMWRWESTLF